MKNLFVSFFLLLFGMAESFYEIPVESSNGVNLNLDSFQGKRVLVVNVATSSPRQSQFSQLQQLNQIYGDSLVILAVPSNSFGNEPLEDSAISNYLVQQYGVTFHITKKMELVGPQKHHLYKWLTDSSLNGSASIPIGADFQKFLISKDGQLVGVFAPEVSPLSEEFLNAFKY